MFNREKSNHESVLLMQQQFELDICQLNGERRLQQDMHEKVRHGFDSLETDQLRTYMT